MLQNSSTGKTRDGVKGFNDGCNFGHGLAILEENLQFGLDSFQDTLQTIFHLVIAKDLSFMVTH